MSIYAQDYETPVNKKSAMKFIMGAFLAVCVVLLAIIGSCASSVSVPAGHVGVVTKFGAVTGDKVYAGLHFLNPVVSVTKMNTQTTELKESASVPSKEGLMLTLEASLIFHLSAEQAPQVYQSIGEDYQAKIVEPTFRAAIREATASHAASALYSSERDQIAQEIYNSVTSQLVPRGVVVEKILMRDVGLPATLRAAIESKQQADQESQAMSFKLLKETQEAQRKRIEAQGIKDFQTIVSQGITPGRPEWQGIEATEKLAYRPNAKIVVIGGGKGGLPMILGGAGN